VKNVKPNSTELQKQNTAVQHAELGRIVRKICGKCQKLLPASSEFFCSNTHSHDGLYSVCHTCRKQKLKRIVGLTRCESCLDLKGNDNFSLSKKVCNSCRKDNGTEQKAVISKSEARLLGLAKYFTGTPCKRGHVAERLVSTGHCETCRKLRKKGLLENINKPKGYWLIKENVLNEAKKYKDRPEMKLKNNPAYVGLCKLDLCVEAFPADTKPNGYWTVERCFEAAKLYGDISEFSTGEHMRAYNMLCREGLITEASKHMSRKRVRNNHWTKKSCKKEALKYNTRNEFRKFASGAYSKASDESWLDEICAHMGCGYKASDTVYIWKVAGFCDLYKIGLSNKRMCESRINIVAKSHGYKIENSWAFTVGVESAYMTEKECLKFGRKAKVAKKDGYTEFRHLTCKQLNELLLKLENLK